MLVELAIGRSDFYVTCAVFAIFLQDPLSRGRFPSDSSTNRSNGEEWAMDFIANNMDR
jgi:hypothetical protein